MRACCLVVRRLGERAKVNSARSGELRTAKWCFQSVPLDRVLQRSGLPWKYTNRVTKGCITWGVRD